MKFFKFERKVCEDDKCFIETHYFNVEDIKEIVVSSSIGNNDFIIRTRGGAVFYIKENCLESLLKLVGID